MYKRPYVAGVHADRFADEGFDRTRMLQAYGNNFGNLLFAEGLYRSLEGAKAGSYSFHPREVDDCDVIVVAAANWANKTSDFTRLADRLVAAGLPVVLVGLGAQGATSRDIPQIKEGTLRLIRLAAESSSMISVRGGYSARVLEYYGFRNVLATGCPSMLANGPTPPVLSASPAGASADEIAIQSTRSLFRKCNPVQVPFYHRAFREKMDIIFQAELADMLVLDDEELNDEAKSVLSETYGAPFEDVRAYIKDHGKAFLRLDDWIGYLKTKRFCVGTRLHGSIAAILAGIPSLLIAHDARTVETARAMRIPVVSAAVASRTEDLTSLYRQEDANALTESYDQYYFNFQSFFRMNGLELKGAASAKHQDAHVAASA
jgi:hypothetical protein